MKERNSNQLPKHNETEFCHYTYSCLCVTHVCQKNYCFPTAKKLTELYTYGTFTILGE